MDFGCFDSLNPDGQAMTANRDKAVNLPIPDVSVLKNWKVKNSSRPFNEDDAIRYLSRAEAQFAERLGKLVDTVLGKDETTTGS